MILKDFITIVKLPFCKNRELYRSFHQMLGFWPYHIRYYRYALIHKSTAVKEEGKRINNERLEFLGDAILDAVVGDIVFRHFPKKSEGFLTNTRSNIVNRASLNKIAREMGLDKLIQSNFTQQTHNSYMNGNAFEALVGAIYLDRGYTHCMGFVEKKILKHLVNIDKAAYNEVNHKSRLIEWGQKNRAKVEFEVTENHTEKTSPTFDCRVLINDIECGTGNGYSKKESQQKAAKEAYTKLKNDRSLQYTLTAPKEQQMENSVEGNSPTWPAKLEATGTGTSLEELKTREAIIAEAEKMAFKE